MVYTGAVGYGGRGRVWVSIDDFVATLFAFADYRGDAAEDAFTFKGGAVVGGPMLGVVPVEDFGLGRESGTGI